jgi:hypothetical protein
VFEAVTPQQKIACHFWQEGVDAGFETGGNAHANL